jgi:hypothetical protein
VEAIDFVLPRRPTILFKENGPPELRRSRFAGLNLKAELAEIITQYRHDSIARQSF